MKPKGTSFKEIKEKILKTETQKKNFEEKYEQFLISELVLSFMENDKVSVRELSRALKLSTNTIFKIRSGKENARIDTLAKIIHHFGAEIRIVKNNKTLITL